MKIAEEIEINGVEYVSMKLASEILCVAPITVGRNLETMINNGVRVYRNSNKNKGARLCRVDLEAIKEAAVETGMPLFDIVLPRKK